MGCRTCDKPKMNYRKGLWSPEEDQRLRDYILKHGLGCWSAVPAKAGLQRNGKSCRLRWINYLRPGLKRGMFSGEEEDIVINLQAKLGNKWSQIAMHLPGRTDNEVKNYWNSYLKKRVMQAQGSNPTNHATPTAQSVKNSSLSTTTLHDQKANISRSSVAASAPASIEPFEHQTQQQQQAKSSMFSDWPGVTRHDGSSICAAHWPASTASSRDVALSDGAMSSSCYGAVQQQQEEDQGGHGGAAIAGGGYFDLLNMGDIYGGFSTTNDDLFF